MSSPTTQVPSSIVDANFGVTSLVFETSAVGGTAVGGTAMGVRVGVAVGTGVAVGVAVGMTERAAVGVAVGTRVGVASRIVQVPQLADKKPTSRSSMFTTVLPAEVSLALISSNDPPNPDNLAQ